ncbi:MAG: sensor histidine kinase [Phycisphaerales bacterium]|nr:MAG: sensor histidine kinase [Phycisphaerales bacterium]
MMYAAKNVTRLAILSYALICALVLGGMAAATRTAARLEKLEAAKAIEDAEGARLGPAVRQMNEVVSLVLEREFPRAYNHYSAHYPAPNALNNRGGPAALEGGVWLSSPLYKDPPPRWIELYFQVERSRDLGHEHWSSPQLPQYSWLHQYDPGRPALNESQRGHVQSVLTYVESRLPLDEIEDMMENARAAASRRDDAPEAVARVGSPGDTQRGQYLLPSYCDPEDTLALATPKEEYACVPREDDAMRLEEVLVQTSPFVPFWVSSESAPRKLLAFIRSATMVDRPDLHDQTRFQGFVVDWDRFSQEVLDRYERFYPGTQLTPVFDESRADPRTRLSRIPATVTLPPLARTATAAGRSTLIISWAAAIVALAALGIGVRTLVVFTTRRVQFAYAVAHELRTPLTTFRLYTDMLAAGMVPEAARQEYLDTLNRESKRLGDLVNGVLEYARLEHRAVHRKAARVTGADIAERLQRDYAPACADDRVRLVVENALPPEQSIETDLDLLMCVAGVLISNAVRHARDGDSPEIRVQLERVNGHVCLSVIDNGPGIAAEDVRYIYRPFRQGRGRDAGAKGGLGLGLALARKWVSLLGGRIDLAARQHATYGGAAFRISIPCR